MAVSKVWRGETGSRAQSCEYISYSYDCRAQCSPAIVAKDSSVGLIAGGGAGCVRLHPEGAQRIHFNVWKRARLDDHLISCQGQSQYSKLRDNSSRAKLL